MDCKFSFPKLKPSEILTCMGDLQIPMSMEDLEKPSTPRMLTICEQFTDILMGVSRDQYAQPNFAAMDILEFPDLHQDSITLLSFFRQLTRLVIDVGVPDFSLRDIIKPEPPRVRQILSAVINFAKFREERLSVFEDCSRKSAEYMDQRQFLLEKKQDLAEKVNTLRLARAEEEPEFQRRREDNMRLTAELRELKRVQTAMTSEIDALKKSKTEVTEKLTNTQFLLMNCKQDCARLRSRIVQSPEKLQQVLLDMNQSVQSEKVNINALEKRGRDLQTKLEMMAAIDQDMVSCIKMMEECEAEMKKLTAMRTKIQEEREGLEKKQIMLSDLDIKEQQIRRQLKNVEEKRSRLQKQHSQKTEYCEAKRCQLEDENEAINREMEANQLKAEANFKKLAEIEQKISDLKKKSEAETASLRNDCATLKARADQFRSELARVL